MPAAARESKPRQFAWHHIGTRTWWIRTGFRYRQHAQRCGRIPSNCLKSACRRQANGPRCPANTEQASLRACARIPARSTSCPRPLQEKRNLNLLSHGSRRPPKDSLDADIRPLSLGSPRIHALLDDLHGFAEGYSISFFSTQSDRALLPCSCTGSSRGAFS